MKNVFILASLLIIGINSFALSETDTVKCRSEEKNTNYVLSALAMRAGFFNMREIESIGNESIDCDDFDSKLISEIDKRKNRKNPVSKCQNNVDVSRIIYLVEQTKLAGDPTFEKSNFIGYCDKSVSELEQKIVDILNNAI